MKPPKSCGRGVPRHRWEWARNFSTRTASKDGKPGRSIVRGEYVCRVCGAVKHDAAGYRFEQSNPGGAHA